ncbi:sensor histidine kinase [Gemmatimonadota bacterium]
MLEIPRDPDAPGIRARDWVLAALVLLLALHQRTSIDGALSWLAIGMTLIVAFAVPWRRSHPLLVNIVYVGAFGAAMVVHSVDEVEGMMLAGVLITYALLRWASGRQSAIGFIVLLVTYVSHSIVYGQPGLYDRTLATGLLLLPAFVGGTMRYLAEGRRRLIDDARFGERVQLARELHDTVAHHVSAIAIQSQAARVVATSRPDVALQALKAIEETASNALTEMRKVVGALRDTNEVDTAPQRRLADIKRLARSSQNGPRIEVSFSGELNTLDPSVEAGLYRIAQESITNVRRHARNASCITVRVDGTADGVCLTVADDGDAGSPSKGQTPGYGLTGMKERATLLGGEFEAGPGPDGGWRVRAVLPNTRV